MRNPQLHLALASILLATSACSSSEDAAATDASPSADTDASSEVQIIRGRFESTSALRQCGALAPIEGPDGALVKAPMNLCGDDIDALADTLLANLQSAESSDKRLLIVLSQGTNLPTSWLGECDTVTIETERFSGDLCLPWDASYLANLESALGIVAERINASPALAGVYFTTTTMTNGAEFHFRVPRSEFPYPGDETFRDSYKQVMDLYQDAFDVPILFEAGHCIWSDEADCTTPLELYRHARDTHGPSNIGIAIWNCAERFWAQAPGGEETYGVRPLLEEATADGVSFGCQTVGSFTQGACRFSDDAVADYGDRGDETGDTCPADPAFNPEAACVDTMNWFAGASSRAPQGVMIRGTWSENWTREFRPGGIYVESAACKAAIDQMAP